MIDPWKKLDNWNKPYNQNDDIMERVYEKMLVSTKNFEKKRIIHRGETKNVINILEDKSLDFCYIDGDHTLRGITIDLISIYPKIKDGGWIGGDDLCYNIFQHVESYEPTMIFPFVVHFAEAHHMDIYAIPHNQFLMKKSDGGGRFFDLVGIYKNSDMKFQFDKFKKCD